MRQLLLALLLCTFATEAQTPCNCECTPVYEVYSGCEMPAKTFVKDIYVDPVNGLNTNDGSITKPWKSIGYAEATTKKLVGGEHIHMLPGKHVTVSVNKWGSPNLANTTAWIWLDFKPGAEINMVSLSDTKKWLVTGATFKPATVNDYSMSANYSKDIVFFNNKVIGSDKEMLTLTKAEWLALGNAGGSRGTVCGAWIKNDIKNVRHGIFNSHDALTYPENSSKILVKGNTIVGLSGDAFRPLGSDVSMIGNTVKYGFVTDADGDKNHDDMIQLFALPVPKVYQNLLVEGNYFQDKGPAGAASNYNAFQGLGFFDGAYKNITVRKNVFLGGAYHGIALFGVDGATVESNTVMSTALPGTPTYNKYWIQTPPSKSGVLSKNVIVRNNIANVFYPIAAWTVNVNNVVITDPANHFQAFDSVNGVYDMRLKATSAHATKGVGAL